jgi:hypothetical protein
MIDIFNYNISNKKIAFSGTINFYKLNDICKEVISNYDIFSVNPKYIKFNSNLFSNIISDNKSKGSIYSAIYGITTISSSIENYDNSKNNNEIENNFIENILTEKYLKKYDAIIDSGGLIISTNTNIIIENIYNKLIEYKIDKILLFINNLGEKMIYYNSNNIKKYNNEKFDKLLIFYDHKHTIGIDFKQPSKMHGLVSISSKNTLTQIAQGIFRLRNINIGHSIDFYCPINLDTIDKLKEILETNEIIYKENTKNNLKLQFIKFLNRYIMQNKDSYLENIYYDLIKYKIDTNHIYLSLNNFYNINFIDKFNTTHADIVLNKIEFDNIVSNSTHVQLKEKIKIIEQIEEDIEYDTNTNSAEDYSNRCNIYTKKFTYDKVNLDIITKPYSKFIIEENTFHLELNNWYFNFSENVIFNMYDVMWYTNFFYLVNYTSKLNVITILSDDDYYHIIDEYYDELNTTKNILFNNIIIYNEYGEIVFQKNKSLKDIIPDYIKILIFNIDFPLYEMLNNFRILKFYIESNNNEEIINIFFKCLYFKRKYDYKLLNNNIPVGDFNIYETWQNIFKLPSINDEQMIIFTSEIIDEYINNYIIYDLIDKDERIKDIWEDSHKIILFDEFRKLNTNNVTLNGYIIDPDFHDKISIPIKIRVNFKLSRKFIFTQKILNIIVWYEHRDIQLIKITDNYIIFESEGHKGKFQIKYKDDEEELKRKYLKYKMKYLELKKLKLN